MRRFDATKLLGVCLLAGGIQVDASAAPAFTVEVIDSPSISPIDHGRANHNGQVAFVTWEGRHFVWATGGVVREVNPPAGFDGSPHIGPAGEVYLTQHNELSRSVRIHPDGHVEHLALADSPLYQWSLVPGFIHDVAPGGRVVGVHPGTNPHTIVMAMWEPDGVAPTISAITTPNYHDRYEEHRASNAHRGVGVMYPNQVDPSVPAMRDQGVLRPLPMAGRNTGVANGISSDGRFAVGGAVTRTDDSTYLQDHVAILWTDEGHTVLSMPDWALVSGATDVNRRGEIVGGVGDEERSSRVFWDAQGNVHELESLLVTDRTMGLVYVSQIDDQGRILVEGWEQIEGRYYNRWFFLTPIPEPAMVGVVVLLGVGLRRVR